MGFSRMSLLGVLFPTQVTAQMFSQDCADRLRVTVLPGETRMLHCRPLGFFCREDTRKFAPGSVLLPYWQQL